MENKRIEVNPNMFIITGSINNELNQLKEKDCLIRGKKKQSIYTLFKGDMSKTQGHKKLKIKEQEKIYKAKEEQEEEH